ncbi:unnamed protein product [Cochlearia groenlandica]
MGYIKRLLILTIILLMFLSQSLLLCSCHDEDEEVGDHVTRKLGVFIRKRARFGRRRPRSTTGSASATLLSTGSFACLAFSFLISFLF